MNFPSSGLLFASLSSPEIIFRSKHKEIEFASLLQGKMIQLRNISLINNYVGGAHHNFLLCNKSSFRNSWKYFHFCGDGEGEKVNLCVSRSIE